MEKLNELFDQKKELQKAYYEEQLQLIKALENDIEDMRKRNNKLIAEVEEDLSLFKSLSLEATEKDIKEFEVIVNESKKNKRKIAEKYSLKIQKNIDEKEKEMKQFEKEYFEIKNEFKQKHEISDKKIEENERKIDALTMANEEFMNKLDEYEKEADKNKIQIYVKIKPAENPALSIVTFRNEKTIIIKSSKFSCLSQPENKAFYFDHIFDETSQTDKLFEKINLAIGAVVNGRNFCIIAYGTSGTGKHIRCLGIKQPKVKAWFKVLLMNFFRCQSTWPDKVLLPNF